MTTEKDETFTILVKGKPLASVKADLIHAFLSVSLSAFHKMSYPKFLSDNDSTFQGSEDN